ncbi:hypothetical protein ACIQHY_28515 [Streptomyces sp. NPDC092359]|uniref:hypothetical protein n=1 Tax=Streptomyces sp. NPDC092359 TaxID=3366014 RepID=UPI0037F80BFE
MWLRTPLAPSQRHELITKPEVLIPDVLALLPATQGHIEVFSPSERRVLQSTPYAPGKTHDPEVGIAAHLQEYASDLPALARAMAAITAATEPF